MTPEVEKHLQQVEQASNKAKALLSRHKYPDDLRTLIVAGFIDQMIEHHEAMLVLIRAGKFGIRIGAEHIREYVSGHVD